MLVRSRVPTETSIDNEGLGAHAPGDLVGLEHWSSACSAARPGGSRCIKAGLWLPFVSVAASCERRATMGVTAMAVGGTFGILAKGTVNRLMKVSLRRGEEQQEQQEARTNARAPEVDLC